MRGARLVPLADGSLALLTWSGSHAQSPWPRDSRFAGLEWTFARIRYQGSKLPGLSGCDTYDECWTIDYPAAEQNLSRRVRTVTAIEVNDPVVIDLDDPALWT